MENVFVLRTPRDANAVLEAAAGKHVVVLGSSFIGMEVAAALKPKAASVSVIGTSAVPFQRILGHEIGSAIKRLFEEKGVAFWMKRTITEFRGDNGVLTHVLLSDGQVLQADVCLLGSGAYLPLDPR